MEPQTSYISISNATTADNSMWVRIAFSLLLSNDKIYIFFAIFVMVIEQVAQLFHFYWMEG